MTTLTDTQVVTASGGLVELGYSQITSVVNITGTSAASPTTVISPMTVVCDGSPILVEFYAPYVYVGPTAGAYTLLNITVDGSAVGRWSSHNYTGSVANINGGNPAHLSRRLTLSAGTHTIGVVGWYSVATGAVGAGNASAADAYVPAFLRVSKIVQATQWPAVTTGTIICTSTTRPASPFVGQKIYETDTKKELTYDGTAWTQPWNQPWGVVGIGTHDTGAVVAANTSFCSVTFTPVLNRYYQAFYTERTIWATGGTIGIFDSVAGGRIAEQYGTPDPVTLQRTKTFSSTASRTLSIRTDGVQTPISGSYSGNERPAQLVVMDVGPA